MTSACIFKDTLRNDTQVFLKFKNSILEICLHLIISNFTSYFLPSSMQSSGAGTSNEIPLQESGLALPAMLITLAFSFFEISYSLDKIHSILFIERSPIFRWLRVIPTCSMCNRSQANLVHSGTTRQISLIRLRYPNCTQHGCPQSRRSHP